MTDYPYIANNLLAPTYKKDYNSDDVLARVWNQIVESVEKASEITIIGYSLPSGDQAAVELLSHGLQKNQRCKTVTVVSPSSIEDTQWYEVLERTRKRVTWIPSTFQKWIQLESKKARRT